jgi:hypothetical protein
MSALNIAQLVASPIIAGLVAILLTGKINAGLARRADARTLRFRLSRALLTGDAREQSSWWQVPDEKLTDVEARLVAIGDETAPVHGPAAQAIWHAAQMIPVFRRARSLYDDAVRGIDPALEKHRHEPQHYGFDYLAGRIGSAIDHRDAALDSLARAYADMLKADRWLAGIGRWLRAIDRSPTLPPPSTLVAAQAYAQRYLEGAARWQEPDFDDLEVHRVYSVVVQIPPAANIEEVDSQLPRRNLVPKDENHFGRVRDC